jgi:hypothetical protein
METDPVSKTFSPVYRILDDGEVQKPNNSGKISCVTSEISGMANLVSIMC